MVGGGSLGWVSRRGWEMIRFGGGGGWIAVVMGEGQMLDRIWEV